MGAQRLAHAALQTIAHYGFTQRARRGEAEAGGQGGTLGRMQAESGEIPAGHTDAQLVSATELRWP